MAQEVESTMNEYFDILHANVSSDFHVEYTGFLSNHLSHGIIALHRLGADTERLLRFVNWYKDHLQNPEGNTTVTLTKPEERTANLIREKSEYYHMLEYYTNKYETIYNHDDFKLNLFLKEEYDKLHDGLVGSALHGIIQLGYGFVSRSPEMVCEGLAYIHHSHMPLVLSTESQNIRLGQGTKELIDVLQDFGKEKELTTFMLKEVKKDYLNNIETSSFQRRLLALLGKKGDEIVQHVIQVKIKPIDTDHCTKQDAIDICKWMVDSALMIFATADKRNDYFLIHNVTACWSLYEILPAISCCLQAEKSVKTLLCCLFASYMALDCPQMNHKIQDEDLKFKTWDEIKEVTLELDCDEHIYKLVQVAYDMSQENVDPEKETLYKTAANVALGNNLTFM